MQHYADLNIRNDLLGMLNKFNTAKKNSVKIETALFKIQS